MSPKFTLPNKQCAPHSPWRHFAAALVHQARLLCVLMFVFSVLLVFSNSLEQWGCCWLVRTAVGCWLEVTAYGLITLTRDILRNTKDKAFIFYERGRGEREWMCANEWTSPAGFITSLHCSVRNDCPALSLLFARWPLVCILRQCSPSWRAPYTHPGASEFLKRAQPLQSWQWDLQLRIILRQM